MFARVIIVCLNKYSTTKREVTGVCEIRHKGQRPFEWCRSVNKHKWVCELNRQY